MLRFNVNGIDTSTLQYRLLGIEESHYSNGNCIRINYIWGMVVDLSLWYCELNNCYLRLLFTSMFQSELFMRLRKRHFL